MLLLATGIYKWGGAGELMFVLNLNYQKSTWSLSVGDQNSPPFGLKMLWVAIFF